ncbi:MAG: hypothetical protein J0L91_10525 [Burkholderiales bacterium]|nr:hypothetical protein [Burkholderiales bacterium]
MRLHPGDLASLLGPRRPKVSAASCASIGRQHRIAVLALLARYGHCRTAEVARSIWPHARYGMQLAGRALRRLRDDGLVAARRNAIGTTSFLLTRRGAATLNARAIAARPGCDIVSVSGATFIHRCIECNYAITRELAGGASYGEHAIQGGAFAASARELAQRFGKLPDCLVVEDGRLVDWCEVEAAAKSRAELVKCLQLARWSGHPLIVGSGLRLRYLVLVYESASEHEKRILHAARHAWGFASPEELSRLHHAVRLVSATMTEGLRWVSSFEKSLYDVLTGRGSRPEA